MVNTLLNLMMNLIGLKIRGKEIADEYLKVEILTANK